ncbi:MAG: monovalent cation/H+ antiporter subunit D family protein [Nannocystaceae bacterium]
MDISPLSALAIPAVGAFLIGLAGRWPNLREAVTLTTAAGLCWVIFQLVPTALAGGAMRVELAEIVPGLMIALHIEPLGMIFAVIASSLWILNSLYSIGYMRANNEKHQTRFYICFALSITCVMGLAFAANLLTMFIFYEALSLATFPLVTHKGSEQALKSGRTYLGILVGTSVCLFLPAIIATYVYTGTIDFVPGGVFRSALETGKIDPALYGVIFAMFMYGIGKAALMPSQRWLPAAMVAPTPVSALLHAVAVVKAGVFSLTKVTVYIVGIDTLREYGQGGWLVYAAGFTIITASFIALFQDNLKRRLAYSTVSQLSYIVLGTALLWPISIVGAALHIAAHAFGKITLFFAAGSIYTAAHKTLVSELDGIGRRMPWTMGAFTVGTLSMIGLPPTAGFISKWYLISGAWKSGHVVAIAVIVVSTLLNAAYFLPIVYRAFFRPSPPTSKHAEHGEAPLPIVIALTGTALAAVSMFFYPDLFLGLAQKLGGNLR